MWIQSILFSLLVTDVAFCAFPTPKSSKTVDKTIKVSGSYDGELVRYIASKALGDGGQGEDQKPIFDLADGAHIKNVIIGTPAADGIHCLGSCTIENVWWEDVGEDAATFKGASDSVTMLVTGGGAKSASDKVFQHNGGGTATIKNFEVINFGKLYRSCGNCKTQHKRHVVLENISITPPGKTLVGINSNLGDTAKISHITVHGDKSHKVDICDKYEGVTHGEPKEIGKGADSTNCLYKDSDITYTS